MTTTQTDAIMAMADRYAFHIPGSQHSDEARAALLAALQEQARDSACKYADMCNEDGECTNGCAEMAGKAAVWAQNGGVE